MRRSTKAGAGLFTIAVILCGLSPAAGISPRDTAGADGDFRVIAYVSGRTEDTDKYPVEHLTHVIFSFLHLQGDRLIVSAGPDSANIARLVGWKVRNPRLRVLVSVGGWGGCETCSEVFATADGREHFAASARELMERCHVDGIDLDWEFPAIEGFPGHRYSPDDREHFTLLLRALRHALGDRYEVSFAAGGFSEYLVHAVDWQSVVPLVDGINLMTYDLVNGFSTRTGHHAPLFSTPEQTESADHGVRFLDSLGIPPGKIVIGAAFYARTWESVGPAGNGLYQRGKFTSFVPYREFQKYFGKEDGEGCSWDSVAQAPYIYDASKKRFATFDNRRSVSAKTRYALQHHLGGIMFWELNCDLPHNGLLDAIDRTRQSQK